jgi:hypothetical protein
MISENNAAQFADFGVPRSMAVPATTANSNARWRLSEIDKVQSGHAIRHSRDTGRL